MKNLLTNSKVYRLLSMMLLIVFLITLFYPMGTLTLSIYYNGLFPQYPLEYITDGISLLDLAQGGYMTTTHRIAAQPLVWIIIFGAISTLFAMIRSLKRSIHFIEGSIYALFILIIFITLRLLPSNLSDNSYRSIALTDTTHIFLIQSILLLASLLFVLIGGFTSHFFDKTISKDNLDQVYMIKNNLHDWKI
ncbi:MAG: hypothetical protein RBT45_05390 [Acholeplasmataceae bacterium]|nr:hypothetical protein [Acholeplasmataceae bacterium]